MSKKIYFASDFHLGVPNFEVSLFREKKINSLRNKTTTIPLEDRPSYLPKLNTGLLSLLRTIFF
jgi:hypothetical protein